MDNIDEQDLLYQSLEKEALYKFNHAMEEFRNCIIDDKIHCITPDSFEKISWLDAGGLYDVFEVRMDGRNYAYKELRPRELEIYNKMDGILSDETGLYLANRICPENTPKFICPVFRDYSFDTPIGYLVELIDLSRYIPLNYSSESGYSVDFVSDNLIKSMRELIISVNSAGVSVDFANGNIFYTKEGEPLFIDPTMYSELDILASEWDGLNHYIDYVGKSELMILKKNQSDLSLQDNSFISNMLELYDYPPPTSYLWTPHSRPLPQ